MFVGSFFILGTEVRGRIVGLPIIISRMEIAILGVALGVLVCQMQASLFPLGWPIFGLFSCVVFVCKTKGIPRKLFLLCLGFLLGFIQADWRAQVRLNDRLNASLEGRDIELFGRISDLPQSFEGGLRFIFAPDEEGLPRRVLLNWYVSDRQGLDLPRAGERWRLSVRLKRPHGNLNPNGFDYEAWLFERGIGATGYVRAMGRNECLSKADSRIVAWLDRTRDKVRERFIRFLPDSPRRGILIALAVGDQGAIPQEYWTLFARTGVTHLMSISGLHVTMTGILFGWLVSTFWRRFAWLMLRLPAQKAGVFAGLLAAGFYVLLAGSGIPAQRTFYMFFIGTLSVFLGLESQVRRTLLVALLLVLVIDPWAVLSPGFWLSFVAVAAILMFNNFSTYPGAWKGWFWSQWAVSLLSLPILLGIFQQFSLISPLANAVAIPAISLLIAPLTLLFSASALSSIVDVGDGILEFLMEFLQWCADLPFSTWQQAAPPVWLVLASCLGSAWFLMPSGVPARWGGLFCCLPLLTWSPPRPEVGTALIRVLDVGQGLSVHVQTANHDLLYDVGPRYSESADAGGRVVVPYLRAEGVKALDVLVVSHDDKDHSGGLVSVFDALPVRVWQGRFMEEGPQRFPASVYRACVRGMAWSWDGVVFEFLHPPEERRDLEGNDASCVMKISTLGTSLLLSGDIGARAERIMVKGLGEGLKTTVVVAPHHGSRNSSHEEFVGLTSPVDVVFSNGYRNRFHHPDEIVVKRYQTAGARVWRTDRDGALSIRLVDNGHTDPVGERSQRPRYWRNSL